MSTAMVVYTGNVIKIPKEQQEPKAIVHRQSSTAIAMPKRTLFDELDEFMNHGDTNRPRIESKPENEPFVVNRSGESKPKKTESSPPKAAAPKAVEKQLDDSILDKYHCLTWYEDDVTVSNLKIGTSGRQKSITITLSTSDAYRFGRLLEQVEKTMPKTTPPARKPASRKPPARR